jgi:hypothetical protein
MLNPPIEIRTGGGLDTTFLATAALLLTAATLLPIGGVVFTPFLLDDGPATIAGSRAVDPLTAKVRRR